MLFVPFSFRDFIDIVLVAIFMYWIYRSMRGTNAPYALTGIMGIYILWIVVRALNMELLSSIFGAIISVGAVALIVVFQPEIRRFLHNLGMRRYRFGILSNIFNLAYDSKKSEILPVVEAAAAMSRSHRGAIFVLTQLSDMQLITEGGVYIDAKISAQLLRSIYSEGSPLSDGAVVINSGRVVAAKCTLPVTQGDVPMSLGMRHRAAIGLSEVSDAIIVVVSQQTGQIAIARSGHLTKNLSADDLASELSIFVSQEEDSNINKEEVAQ